MALAAYSTPSAIPGPHTPQSPEQRAIVERAERRRLALLGEQQALKMRYEEIMQWANPPWDPVSKRLDPRPEEAGTQRKGHNKVHIDKIGPVLQRWSVLEMGKPPAVRIVPKYIAPPVPDADPNKEQEARFNYNIDRLIAQNQATQMENLMDEWMTVNNFQRTMLWSSWAKHAFGKSIVRTAWDPVDKIPTIDLLENPAQVYYGWTKLQGRRLLSWVNVAEEIAPEEANYRFGTDIPIAEDGSVNWAAWTGFINAGPLEQRAEQQGMVGSMVWIEEYWELNRVQGKLTSATNAFIVGGRVVDGPHEFPWNRLPFHIFERDHIPTYQHGKSTAEAMIPINEAYDDMLDRQHTVIEFEAGPRYKGINMAHNREDIDVPDPFQMIPLREGEDIQQLDTRVDFFPTQLHSAELKESKYETTGLTPIAEGMSSRAMQSGRALTAEWRAVELPLFSYISNAEPEIIDIIKDWWDFAEFYDPTAKQIGKGYRRIRLKWDPVDVRDDTEKAMYYIQLLNAHLLDPETIMEELGYENVDDIMAKIKAYMTDPIYNPIGYQQYLVLKELSQRIEMQDMQIQAQQGQGQPPPDQAAAQGAQGMAGAPQQPPPGQPQGPAGPAQNQPGQTPPPGGNQGPQIGLLSRSPLQGGSGSQVTATLPIGGPSVGAPGGGIPIG